MISLLVVNYRSAALAAEAIRTARAACSTSLQVVVVDNSDEADALRPHADVVIASKTNRGYAGGINDGRRLCTGEVIVACNPDVTFAAGAINALAAELARGAAVAGPALFWDDAHTWLLPPAELHTGREKLDEILAGRSPKWAAQRGRRRFRRRLAFWSATATRDVEALSGAVLAIRADAFDALGGFDERFALYFEETDFLRRAGEQRMRIAYVPAARCRHLYNQSAGQVASEAASRYAQSELRYLEKWNGPFLARLLKRLEKNVGTSFSPSGPAGPSPHIPVEPVIIEASPLANFDTAAGHFASQPDLTLPPEVAETWRGGPLYLRAVTPDGEVVATIEWRS
ncbi:MAG TPA: glycosyltransferase [Thermoanaerobaculia bacterium]|jgi:GT2 family glycosyltransferase|nr:glycosyltransferase [Thermoanaerobaculia bacterium]